MRRTRGLVGLVVAVVALATLATPAAAQSLNRLAIDDLNEQLLYVALPLTLFVELTLFYAIYRFHDNDDPKPTVDDPALEITWTFATGAILVFVGISAFFVLSNPYLTPAAASSADPGAQVDDDEVLIEVEAYQWGWEFDYAGENVTTKSQLVLPTDRDVRFVMRSRDVIHSLYVPELGVKQDIIPGQRVVARTHPTATGNYTLYCAELCGSGHTRMHATVTVLNESAYGEWLANESS